MSFSITRSTTHQAIIIVFEDEYDFAKDAPVSDQQMWDMLEQEDQPVAVIANILEYRLGVENLFRGTNAAMKSNIKPYKHPNCATLIIVSNHKLLQMSIDGFNKFGVAKSVKSAKSLDEALAMTT